MAVRTIDETLAQVLRFLPDQYAASSDVLSGLAAQMVQAEQTGEDLVTSTTVAGAAGKWLTLLAHGYGLERRTDEEDAEVRTRVRSPEGQLTVPAILERINAIIAPYSSGTAWIVEWWETGSYLDYDYYLGLDSRLPVAWNSFVLILPADIGASWGHTFLDYDYFLGITSYLGTVTNPIVPVVVDEVAHLRASGVHAWVAIAAA